MTSRWSWAAVALAFPLAGYLGGTVSGPVDGSGAALLGGALTGAGIAATQWWAARDTLGRASGWIGVGSAGYAVGLATGAKLVGYDTDLGSLALMGVVSGAVLGVGQGLLLAVQSDVRLGWAWGVAMPILFALGWVATSAIGASVEEQFTVFGAAGAAVFTGTSWSLLAWLSPTGTSVISGRPLS